MESKKMLNAEEQKYEILAYIADNRLDCDIIYPVIGYFPGMYFHLLFGKE